MLQFERTKLKPEQIGRIEAFKTIAGARTFLPNRPQYEFARAVGNQPKTGKRIFLVTSGNGTGKTTAAWNILANIIYPGINIWRNITDVQTNETISGFFDFPLFTDFPKHWPPNIWYVSNKDSLASIHVEMPNWMPNNGFVEHFTEGKDGKSYVSRVKFKGTRWNLFYKTVDQDPKTFESANISIVVFDEPPPKELFHAAVSRLRSGGIIIIAATPLWDAAWFIDDIVEKVHTDPDKWHQRVSVWENCIEKAGHWHLGTFGKHPKGNLYQEDIEFMIRNWDEEQLPARVDGKFMQLSGLIIRNYDPQKVFVPVKRLPNRPIIYNYRFVVDPHDRRPPAAAWFRLSPYGRIEVVREWPSREDVIYKGKYYIEIRDAGNHTILDFVKNWMEIEQDYKIPKTRIDDFMDPNFGKKIVRQTGKRVWQDYYEASVKVGHREYAFNLNANDNIEDGHAALRRFLKPTLNGDQLFVIDHRCHNIDRAFRRYAWKKETSKHEEEMGLGSRVQEKYKDFIDVCRYCLIVPWDYRPLDVFHGSVEDDYGYAESENWRRVVNMVRKPDDVV